MSRFARSRSLTKRRVKPYRPTPEIVAEQRALIGANFTRCERSAFTMCADPRVDTECVVEDAFAWICADWMRPAPDRAAYLDALVREYASQALKAVPGSWAPRYWQQTQYAKLFAGVADAEVMKGLRVIDGMAARAPQAWRIFQARRVFGYPINLTAERMEISVNTIGPSTTSTEQRISKVTDKAAVLRFLATQMDGGF